MNKLYYDLHTHTTYSHGLGSIEENAAAAVERGLSILGITDHGPGNLSYGIKMAELPNMRADIEAAKKAHPKLEILLGTEANIANLSGQLDVDKEQQKLFDYIIAGYHYAYLGNNPFEGIGMCVGGWLYSKGLGELCRKGFSTGDFRRSRNTEIIISAIEENDIKILTHPGDKAPVYIDAVARSCERNGVIMEINAHHDHLTAEEIRIVAEYDVKFILSSDAHKAQNVGDVEEAYKRALAAGLDESRIVNFKEGLPWSL